MNIEDVIFIDCETARNQMELQDGTPDYDAWKYMMDRSKEKTEKSLEELYIESSALYPEFSRVVCISVGRVLNGKLTVTTYSDSDESVMLDHFTSDMNRVTKSKPKTVLCGHSVVGFDIPFIFKRCLANQIVPNVLFDTGGLKPWEVTALDTKLLWKGTSFYNSSLISVCLALNIPSPKSDITGAEVADIYYTEGDEGLLRICNYCERDVWAVANILLRLQFKPILENFESKTPSPKKEEGLIERISNTGSINLDDREEILRKAKGSKVDEKEKQIQIIKAALAIHKKDIPEELELDILRA